MLTAAASVAAACATAALLWFGLLAEPQSFSYQHQPDGTWKLGRNYQDDVVTVAFAVAPYLALGVLAWLCRRVRGASWGVLLTTLAVGTLGVAALCWELSRPWSRTWGAITFLAWLAQWLVVLVAYALCGIGWLYRRGRESGTQPDRPRGS